MRKIGSRVMKAELILRGILIFVAVFHVGKSVAVAQHEELTVWPDGLPADAKPLSNERISASKAMTNELQIGYVQTPTLTVFPAANENATGCSVVICPGGGYNILAWPKEGVEVAEWFNSIGVTAFVLKYRVPRRDLDRIHWEPMQDVQRSIRLVRSGAEKWGVDPERIGVLGFSAGGHLAVMAGLQSETESYPHVDEVDKVSCRPNFICPTYAAYLGDDYRDDVAELGELVKINEKTPPTFMAVTWDDRMRGAQAALMFAELRKNNVPAELHIFAKGGHRYGMREVEHPVADWNKDLAAWLESMELLQKESDK